MDIGTYVGPGLMIVGAAAFAVSARRSKRGNVHASQGSVAVGKNNSGQITNINAAEGSDRHSARHALTLFAAAVEIIGIAITLWHAWRLIAK
jgi:hypothetical protein